MKPTSEPSIQFQQLLDSSLPAVDAAIALYKQSFPANERHPSRTIRDRIDTQQSLLYVGLAEQTVVFLSLLWPLHNTEFILLDYLATDPNYRGQGIASLFLNQLCDRLQASQQRLLLEVEHPALGKNSTERAKRVQFYQKLGAKVLDSVPYQLPPLDGSQATEMLLMILPAQSGEQLQGSQVRSLIQQLYRDLYHRDETDPLLKQCLSAVPDPVTLTRWS